MNIDHLLTCAVEEDRMYLYEAYLYAQGNSKDPSTWNGAVIVGYDVIAQGANHFPNGVVESSERWERPLKYSFVEHAERNAIYDAASEGEATKGKRMFCPWFACADCARAIVQSGIVSVTGLKKPFDLTPDHWIESVLIGHQILKEGGVVVRVVDIELGIEVLFNGSKVMM